MDEIIHHLAVFVSRLWQIHIFGEGNTRTTAVFFIKYLRTLGFDATSFGRSIVEQITGLKSSRASEIINLMLENEIIEPVKGKGKYRFM